MKKQFFYLFICSFYVFVYPQSNDRLISVNTSDISLDQQQKSGGSILGTVIDIVDRIPIDKATVEVLGTGMKVVTLKDGQFKISNIPEGFYQVRSTAPGYELQTQNNLYVEDGKPATAFFMLKKIGTPENTVSENSSPVPVSTTSPNYPSEARKNGVEGILYFNLDISETGSIITVSSTVRQLFAEDGKLKDSQVYSKYPQAVNQLEKEALESIWQWKFKPAMKDGKAISSRVTLPVKFKLSKD
jgi:hypothetical protein